MNNFDDVDVDDLDDVDFVGFILHFHLIIHSKIIYFFSYLQMFFGFNKYRYIYYSNSIIYSG